MQILNFRRVIRTWLAACAPVVLLGGCATLPSSGPTGREIIRSAGDPIENGQLQIVEVVDVATLPPVIAPAALPFFDVAAPPTDMVGPGDVLEIAIYEAGVALFGGSGATTAGGGFDSSARAEKLPLMRIDDDGDIQLPYAGRLHVAGLTVVQIERRIRQSLGGLSQNPQVLVSIREAITNSVIVGGEVARPGRLVLPTNRETLSDAIALAGGYRGDAKDLSVRVLRRDVDGQFRLSDVLNGPERDLRVAPGDKISVLRAPRSFSVMGAPGRVEQLPFSASSISLAEAIASSGGANAGLGDPKAIFVFRIERDAAGMDRNVVYHINMMRAGSFFIAQRFAMRDKDVLYFGNARANQPSKLIQLISQLFAPLATIAGGVNAVR